MAIRGQHLEVLAEVLLDGLRLGRRFDDDEVLCHDRKAARRVASGGSAPRSVRVTAVSGSNTSVFHARAGLFLAGLAEQHHQHHPLHLLEVESSASSASSRSMTSSRCAGLRMPMFSSYSSRPRQSTDSRVSSMRRVDRAARPLCDAQAPRHRRCRHGRGCVRRPARRASPARARLRFAETGAFQVVRERLALGHFGRLVEH